MGRPKGLALNRRAFDHELQRWQLATGGTKADLAAECNLSAQMLGDMTGVKRAGASPKTAAALASALSCPVETLFPEVAGFGSPLMAEAA